MAELVDWLNLAVAASTNDAVQSMAEGQAVLVEAESQRQVDNAVVNEAVDLYAKARDLRQRKQLLGAFTLAVTAKSIYYSALAGLKDPQLKMRLIEIDEKINAELSQLMGSQQIPQIVAELEPFLKSETERIAQRIGELSKKLDKRSKFKKNYLEMLNVERSYLLLTKYFDPGLVGALGPLAIHEWQEGISPLERIYSPELQKLSAALGDLDNKLAKKMPRWWIPIVLKLAFWVILLGGGIGFLAWLMWMNQ